MAEEKKFENYLVAEIERGGGMCIKFPPLYLAGFPDRIVLMRGGVIVFVEMKAQAGRVRPIQAHRHDQLRALGFRVEILASRADVDAFILSLRAQPDSEPLNISDIL